VSHAPQDKVPTPHWEVSPWGFWRDLGRDALRARMADGIALVVVPMVMMALVFATILSIEPDRRLAHQLAGDKGTYGAVTGMPYAITLTSCGGSNIVVALRGPQANAPGTSTCQPLAIADVSGATLLLVPFIFMFLVAIKERKRRRITP